MPEKWKDDFYGSRKWKNCRRAYVAERMSVDGGICEECHEAPGFIVHHRIALNKINVNNPDIALNFANFFYVCKECHDKYEGHFNNQSDKNSFKNARKLIKKTAVSGNPLLKKRIAAEQLKKPLMLFDSDGEPLPPGG